MSSFIDRFEKIVHFKELSIQIDPLLNRYQDPGGKARLRRLVRMNERLDESLVEIWLHAASRARAVIGLVPSRH
jgi:hypothetical protein